MALPTGFYEVHNFQAPSVFRGVQDLSNRLVKRDRVGAFGKDRTQSNCESAQFFVQDA